MREAGAVRFRIMNAFRAPYIAVPVLAGLGALSLLLVMLQVHLQEDLSQITEDRSRLLHRYGENVLLILTEPTSVSATSRRDSLLRNLAPANSPISAALLDSNLHVLASSDDGWHGLQLQQAFPDSPEPPEPGSRSAVTQALKGHLHVYYPWPVVDPVPEGSNDRPAWFYLSADIRSTLQQQSDHVHRKMWSAAALTIVASLLFGMWLYRRLGRLSRNCELRQLN